MGFSSVFLLLWLRFKGNLRQRFKELASLRGMISASSIIVFVGGLIYFANLHLDNVALELIDNHQDAIPAILPLGVIFAIASTVLMGSGPAIYFNQAEVNLLWTAPVSRACLVGYKLFSYSASAVFTSLLIVVLLPGDFDTRVTRFIALFLTLTFVQTGSTALRMTIAAASQSSSRFGSGKLNGSRLGNWAIVVVSTILVFVIASQLIPSSNLPQVMSQSWMNTLILPFTFVSSLMLHHQFGPRPAIDFFIVTVMIGLLMCIIVYLDRRLDQAMLEESGHAQRRWARALRSGVLSARIHTSNHSSRPLLRMAGLGPIIWSRWIYSIRSTGHVLTAMIITAGLIGLVAGALLSSTNSTYLASAAFFASVYFLPRVLVFDFRGAPQLMEALHGLPLPGSVICLAQIMVPVFWKTIIEITVITGMLMTAPRISLNLWVMTLCTLPLINFIIIGLDNLLFMLRPSRLLPVGRMDFDFLGRTLFEFLIKSIVLMLVATIATGAAYWIVTTMNGHWLMFAVAFYAATFASGCILHIALARAYAMADITLFDRL